MPIKEDWRAQELQVIGLLLVVSKGVTRGLVSRAYDFR